jgi:hypothetical protein
MFDQVTRIWWFWKLRNTSRSNTCPLGASLGCSLTLSTVISTADRCTIMLLSQLTRQRCLTLRQGGQKSYHPLRSRLSVAKQTSSRLAAAAAPVEAAVPEGVPAGPDAIFHGLCNASGIDSDAVTIKRISRDKGTGLFAARDIAKGDTLLRWVGKGACSIEQQQQQQQQQRLKHGSCLHCCVAAAAAAAAQCVPWHNPKFMCSPQGLEFNVLIAARERAHSGVGGGGASVSATVGQFVEEGEVTSTITQQTYSSSTCQFAPPHPPHTSSPSSVSYWVLPNPH